MAEELPTKRTTLTASQWTEIEELYALGDVTLDELGERYAVHPTYLSTQLSKRGVKKGSRAEEARDRVREKLHEAQAQEVFETVQKVRETKEQHYTYAKTLSQLAFQMIAQQIKKRESVSAVRDDIKTIREAISALEEGRKTRFSVLGLDKDIQTGEGATPLIVQELTEESIKKLREKQADEFGSDIEEIEAELAEAELETTPDPLERPGADD